MSEFHFHFFFFYSKKTFPNGLGLSHLRCAVNYEMMKSSCELCSVWTAPLGADQLDNYLLNPLPRSLLTFIVEAFLIFNIIKYII